jgi:hypothetical protein
MTVPKRENFVGVKGSYSNIGLDMVSRVTSILIPDWPNIGYSDIRQLFFLSDRFRFMLISPLNVMIHPLQSDIRDSDIRLSPL